MFRVVKKCVKSKFFKNFYSTSVTEHNPPQHELLDFEYKIVRPFSKDMLMNRFNLDIFVYPEIDNNADLDRVNILSEKLQTLLQLLNETTEEQKRQKIFEQLSHSGIFGLCATELYHGHNYNNMMQAKIMEVVSNDIQYFCDHFIPRNLACQAFVLGAKEQQKERFLTDMVLGNIKVAVAINDYANAFTRPEDILTSAVYDAENKEFVVNGRKIGLSGICGVEYIIVFAKTGSFELSPLVIDMKSPGITVNSHSNDLTTYDLELVNVRVPTSNLLNNIPGNELARKLATVSHYGVSSACSQLIRELMKKANDHVFNRSIFGRPLMNYEVIHHNFALFTDAAYTAESLAFFVAGFVDVFPSYDTYIESCLAKVSSLKALQEAIDLCVRVMGMRTFSTEDPELSKTFNSCQFLLRNQLSSLEIRIGATKEALEYLETNLKKESILNKSLLKINLFNTYCVIEGKYYLDSFAHNLHQRVGHFADPLFPELRKLHFYLEKLIKNPEMMKEEDILMTLSDIWIDVFTFVVVLTRASRSISIGLRNHELEVQLVEFHANRKIIMIQKKISYLQEIYDNIENDRESVKRLREMGGYFIDPHFVQSA